MHIRRGVTPTLSLDYFNNRPLSTTHQPSRQYEAQDLSTASGLLDRQRHCRSSQTFDRKPARFCRSVHGTFQVFAKHFARTSWFSPKSNIRAICWVLLSKLDWKLVDGTLYYPVVVSLAGDHFD